MDLAFAVLRKDSRFSDEILSAVSMRPCERVIDINGLFVDGFTTKTSNTRGSSINIGEPNINTRGSSINIGFPNIDYLCFEVFVENYFIGFIAPNVNGELELNQYDHEPDGGIEVFYLETAVMLHKAKITFSQDHYPKMPGTAPGLLNGAGNTINLLLHSDLSSEWLKVLVENKYEIDIDVFSLSNTMLDRLIALGPRSIKCRVLRVDHEYFEDKFSEKLADLVGVFDPLVFENEGIIGYFYKAIKVNRFVTVITPSDESTFTYYHHSNRNTNNVDKAFVFVRYHLANQSELYKRIDTDEGVGLEELLDFARKSFRQ